jgi:hypothetical protein
MDQEHSKFVLATCVWSQLMAELLTISNDVQWIQSLLAGQGTEGKNVSLNEALPRCFADSVCQGDIVGRRNL